MTKPADDANALLRSRIKELEIKLAGSVTKTDADYLNERIDGLTQMSTELRMERDRNREIASAAQKEMASLRDELFGVTVENARLKGYIDCVDRDRPVPAEPMVTVPVSRVMQDHRPMTRSSLYPSERPLPWYRR